MFEKLILLYHYCLHTLNMLLRRLTNRISELFVGLGVTSMFEKLILLYHYCLHTLNMLL